MCKFVVYYRVSTKRQGRSGLGLDAQREAVSEYLRGQPDAQIIGEYTEVESGKRSDRPQLLAAIQHAKNANATLLVAKLDRLARSVNFVSALKQSGCKFIAADLPVVNDLVLYVLAALGEYEAKLISERTVNALKAAKRRGQRLGSDRPGHWDGKEAKRLAGAKRGTKVAAVRRSEKAAIRNASLVEEIRKLRNEKLTWEAIASIFNEKGYETARGNAWQAATVHQIAKRYDAI